MVGHDNSGYRPAWYCATVSITDRVLQRSWLFPVHRWLAAEAADQAVQWVCQPVTAEEEAARQAAMAPPCWYIVTAKTGDRRGAGTDGEVIQPLLTVTPIPLLLNTSRYTRHNLDTNLRCRCLSSGLAG